MTKNDLNPNRKHPYPKSVIFIIGNEFCERFSYYGMRTILVLYFRYVLLYSDDSATQAFHIFAMACYFTPVLGAILADSFIGKFWTILTISIVYAIGNIILSFASISGNFPLTYLGLAAIAIGTGGIKPCVSAFGGDQFKPEQQQELARFFSFFYISINAGSLISTYITPVFRQDVACFGRNDCYPLAFGVPAILMVLAVLLFIVGRFVTKYHIIPPQKDNGMISVVKCVGNALAGKFFKSGPKKNHWLDYAEDKYDLKTINDAKALMRILFLYLPLPIFWALFDQQGSRWTLQATRMNGKITEHIIIKPDQIQVINPLLVIGMIPVFEYVIYPFFTKIKLLKRPLQRMAGGGFMAALSFIICAFIQLRIEQEQPVSLQLGHNHLAVMNGLECPIIFRGQPMLQGETLVFANMNRSSLAQFEESIEVAANNNNNTSTSCRAGHYRVNGNFSLTDGESLLLYVSETIYEANIEKIVLSNFLQKPKGAMLYTVFDLRNMTDEKFSITGSNSKLITTVVRATDDTKFGYINEFEVEIKGQSIVMSAGKKRSALQLDQGATYIQLISGDLNGDVQFTITNVVEKNKLSILIQLIQYIVITCAEIMFSVTGLEFSYSQAPKSMKSVIQAAWLLTVAFGNMLVAVIADLKIFDHQSHEFFFFAFLMIIDIVIFAVMAYFYVPLSVKDDEEEESTSDDNPDRSVLALEPIKDKSQWDE